jgi:hypothetical protein
VNVVDVVSLLWGRLTLCIWNGMGTMMTQGVCEAPSVATAQANDFSINGYSDPNKIAKILGIFDKLEGIKSQGVIFCH